MENFRKKFDFFEKKSDDMSRHPPPKVGKANPMLKYKENVNKKSPKIEKITFFDFVKYRF